MNERHKVLVVDDDQNISELITIYLNNNELYETRTAADGESAIKAFYEFKPDIVVLDLMLPGM